MNPAVFTCEKCGREVLRCGGVDEPAICGRCKVKLQRRINKIDRETERYTKRGRIKKLLSDIPDAAIPESMALQIEEVADPEINDRQHCLGQMQELKKIGDKEIHQLDSDVKEKERGKIVLKPRFR